MIARAESVKMLYASTTNGGADAVPVATIVNGEGRPPVIYRLTRLNADEIANLFESGNPDQESNLLGKGGKHG